jgi:hypothetical protein
MPINTLLESAPDIHSMRCESHDTDVLTATILDHLNEQMVISLDSLISLMPQYVSFPVKETVSIENFWLQVGPDTLRA